jgi:hypothetical protein
VQRRTRQSGFGGEGRTRSAYAFPFFLPAQAESLRPGETGGTDPTEPKRCGSTRAGSSTQGNGPDCALSGFKGVDASLGIDWSVIARPVNYGPYHGSVLPKNLKKLSQLVQFTRRDVYVHKIHVNQYL